MPEGVFVYADKVIKGDDVYDEEEGEAGPDPVGGDVVHMVGPFAGVVCRLFFFRPAGAAVLPRRSVWLGFFFAGGEFFAANENVADGDKSHDD